MTKQVPDSSTQLEDVKTFLRENEALARCREMLRHPLAGTIIDLAKPGNPSGFNTQWDRTAGDLRIVGHRLAKYQRDGWTVAVTALEKALRDPMYVPGKDAYPDDERLDATVVVINPEKTFLMLRWICDGHWNDLNNWLDGDRSSPLCNRLFEFFPSLQTYARDRRQAGQYEGYDLYCAFRDDVVNTDNFSRHFDKCRPLEIGAGQYNDHLEITNKYGSAIHFGYLVDGSVESVNRMIPDLYLNDAATWHLSLPASVYKSAFELRGGNLHGVCFHPDHEHMAWKAEYPSFCSSNVASGMGVMFAPGNVNKYECASLGRGKSHRGCYSDPGELRVMLS